MCDCLPLAQQVVGSCALPHALLPVTCRPPGSSSTSSTCRDLWALPPRRPGLLVQVDMDAHTWPTRHGVCAATGARPDMCQTHSKAVAGLAPAPFADHWLLVVMSWWRSRWSPARSPCCALGRAVCWEAWAPVACASTCAGPRLVPAASKAACCNPPVVCSQRVSLGVASPSTTHAVGLWSCYRDPGAQKRLLLL
jgi:hypothetical protein